MKKFAIEIKESLSKIVEIEAMNYGDAFAKIEAHYNNEEIVLDSSNYSNVDFDLVNLNEFSGDIRFNNFVLKGAEEMLSNLSVEELSTIAFGSLLNAKNKFEQSV